MTKPLASALFVVAFCSAGCLHPRTGPNSLPVPSSACHRTHPHRIDLPRSVAVGKLPDAVLYTGRGGAQPGVKRPTTHSAFKLLYMILYTGGGHTAGCAVLAFVCLQ